MNGGSPKKAGGSLSSRERMALFPTTNTKVGPGCLNHTINVQGLEDLLDFLPEQHEILSDWSHKRGGGKFDILYEYW